MCQLTNWTVRPTLDHLLGMDTNGLQVLNTSLVDLFHLITIKLLLLSTENSPSMNCCGLASNEANYNAVDIHSPTYGYRLPSGTYTQATWEEEKVAWYPLFAHARTSPIMDKLHVVVMRRNNQTRYTAYSVAVVLTRRWLP